MEIGEKKQKLEKKKKEEKYQFHSSTEKMSGTWTHSGNVWAINRQNFDLGKIPFYVSLKIGESVIYFQYSK